MIVPYCAICGVKIERKNVLRAHANSGDNIRRAELCERGLELYDGAAELKFFCRRCFGAACETRNRSGDPRSYGTLQILDEMLRLARRSDDRHDDRHSLKR